MDLRVTPQTLANRAVANARRGSARLGTVQEQAATGRRLLRPSDGPLDIVTVLANKAQIERLDAYLSNLAGGRASLNSSGSALQQAGDILSQARQIAIEGSHAALSPTSYEALAQQVDALLNRMLDTANTQNAGGYLFGGTASQAVPFTVARDGQGRPQSISYAGSQERASVAVNQSQLLATLYPGSQVFQQRQRGATIFTGTTGATAGSGTDSANGQGSLLVRHTATTYAPGSGVQPGTSSVNGDTILGPAGAHTLRIIDTSGTGTAGTVSLNGGPPVPFTNLTSDLRVGGPTGEAVYVNTTAIVPGFSGNVAITADGTLSVDGGATSTAINFSGNQIVTNSLTGAITNVNSTNVRRAGTDQLNYTGTYDTFQILMALRDDLRNTRGLTETQQKESLSQRLGELDRVRNSILQVVGEQSASLEQLDTLENRLREVQLQTRVWTSELEDADLSEVILNLQAQSQLLELGLRASARVLELSLMDFLR